jgi:hypothetical protein
MWHPWFVVDKAIKAVNTAEIILKRPPSIIEIFTMMQKDQSILVKDAWAARDLLSDLFREDMLYFD